MTDIPERYKATILQALEEAHDSRRWELTHIHNKAGRFMVMRAEQDLIREAQEWVESLDTISEGRREWKVRE